MTPSRNNKVYRKEPNILKLKNYSSLSIKLRNFFQKNYLTLIIFCAVMIVSMIPIRFLFKSGFFPMHDDTQIGRVVAMARMIPNFEFPIRWVKDLGYGYGYPIYNFYGPLPYYVGGLFNFLGFGALTSTKLMIGIGMMLSVLVMFFVSKRFFGLWGATVASIMYTFAPYRAVDLYVRGAIGELWAMAFLPMVFFGFLTFLQKKDTYRLSDLSLLSLGIFFTIISHTIIGFMMMILVGCGFALFYIYTLFVNNTYKKSPKVQNISLHTFAVQNHFILIFAILLGLCMSMWFWLPAIVEMKYTNVIGQIGGGADFRNHFVCLSQLWTSNWGYGGSSPGCIDGMSFMVGKIHLIIIGIGLFLLFIPKKLSQNTELQFILISGIFISLSSIILLLSISLPLWNIVSIAAYIQYPWRFLSFTLFGSTIIGGTIIAYIPSKKYQIIGVIFISTVVIYLHTKQFVPQYLYTVSEKNITSDEELRYRVSKISDEFLPKDIIRPTNVDEIVINPIASSPLYKSETVVDTGTYFLSVITSSTDSAVPVKRATFPGWSYLLDRKPYTPEVQNGIPIFQVPKGIHKIELSFSNTPIRLFSNIMSMIVLILFFWYYDKKINM
jgi:hypothetical protein